MTCVLLPALHKRFPIGHALMASPVLAISVSGPIDVRSSKRSWRCYDWEKRYAGATI